MAVKNVRGGVVSDILRISSFFVSLILVLMDSYLMDASTCLSVQSGRSLKGSQEKSHSKSDPAIQAVLEKLSVPLTTPQKAPPHPADRCHDQKLKPQTWGQRLLHRGATPRSRNVALSASSQEPPADPKKQTSGFVR